MIADEAARQLHQKLCAYGYNFMWGVYPRHVVGLSEVVVYYTHFHPRHTEVPTWFGGYPVRMQTISPPSKA